MAKDVKDNSTEEKIKNAARRIFQQKGYAGTRTRDIAEEAGINLALLNYYFRSKERLFDLIMTESLEEFFRSLRSVFDDPNTDFEEKIRRMVENYIENLTANPNLPIFILSELRSHPEELIKKTGAKNVLLNSVFIQQLEEEIEAKRVKPIKPLHFMMNMLGMTVFPFIGSPMIKGMGNIDQPEFEKLMQERKTLIPVWIKVILTP
ncbi:TetR/AcrR family transcriptional regulator [Algoriphagus antarcticus]|uniref:TetR family transcriptional regulator n=1 Tax=Algoriphagus antarcticus TaxID=238540 RepID=A0A3E0DS79_9BACT|nr:TetR family transcriptional regulator [Algoriphagus antarcticus]REG86397.1 TetR family transcriptional regulator [Algoriphagus antarcticus]